MTTTDQLNLLPVDQFETLLGAAFEGSPWIARRAARRRPFKSLTEMHTAMCDVVAAASDDEKLALIRAHPDLVGRLAREGRVTPESTKEQAAAGLSSLSSHEIEQFERYNADYRARFDFPFIICARENKKDAILAAFPVRLQNSRETEVETALAEIYKIARLRLMDLVSEP
jgi:2-oxo-4-hydroxy-4-carboxy-5-ureidoimidazoline decarboxylase